MYLCRGKIFGYLGKHPNNKINKLALPENLKEYLQYNEFIKDKYYVKKPLDDCIRFFYLFMNFF
jgi:hypothetical protein